MSRRVDHAEYQAKNPRSGSLEFSVRLATHADVSGIAAVALTLEGLTLEEHISGATAEIEMQQKDDPLRLVMIAEVDGVVAGYGRARHHETPDGMQPETFPEGWYLSGLLVAREFRRYGIGLELTRQRISWVGERAKVVRFHTSAKNRASIRMHEKLGFRAIKRDIVVRDRYRDLGPEILYELKLKASS